MSKNSIKYILITINILVSICVGILLHKNYKSIERYIFPQKAVRKDILNLLNINLPNKRFIPRISVLVSEKISFNAERKKIIYRPEDGIETRGFLFHPENTAKKYPAVVVLHGHGQGVHNTSITAQAYGLAEKLVQNGYVVFTFSFTDIENSMGYKEHSVASRSSMLKGRPLIGIYVTAAIRAIDYLTFLEYVDEDALGIAGESEGGHTAVYTAAADRRVKSVMDSSYFRSYMDLPENPHVCTCNYVPGVLSEYDFPVTASKIAPRPALYTIGREDNTLSVAISEKLIEDIVIPAYRKSGAEDKIELLIHDGSHEIPMDAAVEWFKKTLK